MSERYHLTPGTPENTFWIAWNDQDKRLGQWIHERFCEGKTLIEVRRMLSDLLVAALVIRGDIK